MARTREDYLFEEYKELRAEIQEKIKLHNSLLTFTISTVITLISLALTLKEMYLHLLPFCIIIPVSMRILYYRINMAKISAYIEKNIESKINGLEWEGKSSEYDYPDTSVNGLRKYINGIRKFLLSSNSVFLFLSGVCCLFYIADIITSGINSWFSFLLPLFLLVWELIITIELNRFKDHKDYFYSKF